jgi:dephospho-CoA kinase
VKKRDNISEDAIRKRIMHQWTDEQKQPLADMVIHNNIMDETVSQVHKLHLQLMHT